MALNIKDPEAERLATEVARLTDTTKTGAVRDSLRNRMRELEAGETALARGARLDRFLRDEAWPQIPVEYLGHAPTRAEREEILGYGPAGV